MVSTVYRRQSMAQLYEKLRAQDDDDDMAWLAQFSPDDKFDEPYVPAVRGPPALFAISSASPASPCSSGSSMSDPGSNNHSSDDHFDSDSDSDVDPEPFSLEFPSTEFDRSCSPSISHSHSFTQATGLMDLPHIPSMQETPSLQLKSTPPPIESNPSPVHFPQAPSILPCRTTRFTRNSSARYRSPVVKHSDEYVYSDSDGDGSEDEYLPSPTPSSRKRRRSARSAPSAVVAPSQKRGAENASQKRPRYPPLPRNIQAASDLVPVFPVAKNNAWACPYCKWVQRNHRTPDLKRHIRTHTRLQRPAQWVCCGVPVKDAKDHDLPADAEPYVWGGEMMVGGCCKEFSRRDALKRHLDNDHITCIGNFTAFSNICEDDT